MPPVNPTQAQLDARLNPPQGELQLPGGLFYDSNDPYKRNVYYSNPDGTYQVFNLSKLAQELTGSLADGGYRTDKYNTAGNIDAIGRAAFKDKFGIDITNLPAQGFQDQGALMRSGRITAGNADSLKNIYSSFATSSGGGATTPALGATPPNQPTPPPEGTPKTGIGSLGGGQFPGQPTSRGFLGYVNGKITTFTTEAEATAAGATGIEPNYLYYFNDPTGTPKLGDMGGQLGGGMTKIPTAPSDIQYTQPTSPNPNQFLGPMGHETINAPQAPGTPGTVPVPQGTPNSTLPNMPTSIGQNVQLNEATGQTTTTPMNQAPPINPDYQVQQGESPDQYTARINATHPNLSPTGVAAYRAANPPISTSGLSNPQTPMSPTQPVYQPPPNAADYTTPPQVATPQETKQSELSKRLQALNTQEAGKAGEQLKQNTAAGVDVQQQAVDDLNNQLATVVNEAATIKLTAQGGQGITTALDQRQRDFALNQNAIKSLGVSSLLNAANGLLGAAQRKADKAVALIYDPIEAEIKAAKENLQLIANDPETTLEEKNRAQKLLDLKNQQSDAIAQQKADTTAVWNLAVAAAGNGASFTPTAQYPTLAVALQAIQKADKATALGIVAATGLAGKEAAPKIIGSASSGYYTVDNQGTVTPLGVGGTSGGGTGGGTATFTPTQLNTGASRAAIPINDFKALDSDTQNFFIHLTSPQAADIGTLLSDVKSGKLTPEAAKANVDAKSMTPAVKDYLKSQIGASVPAPKSAGKGIIANTWDAIKGWLGF